MSNDLLPPEEQFWVRYSGRNEFPLSSTIAAVLHLSVVALMLFGAFSIFDRNDRLVVPLEPIAYDDGGGQRGQDNEPLKGTHVSGEVTGDVTPSFEQPKLNQPLEKPIETPPEVAVRLPDEGGDVPMPVSHRVNQPLQKIGKILKGTPDGVTQKGTGTRGDGPGNGGRILTEKEKRQYRWTMLFRTSDVRDYLRQLNALGAILGIQRKDKSLALIKDLSHRPVQLQGASQHPDRIFWMDDNPQSAAAVATELQLSETPWRIIAYFPDSLEQQLLEKELAFGRRFGRKTEDSIRETKFDVSFRGGQVRLEVVEQK
jgi:hypothetical protein